MGKKKKNKNAPKPTEDEYFLNYTLTVHRNRQLDKTRHITGYQRENTALSSVVRTMLDKRNRQFDQVQKRNTTMRFEIERERRKFEAEEEDIAFSQQSAVTRKRKQMVALHAIRQQLEPIIEQGTGEVEFWQEYQNVHAKINQKKIDKIESDIVSIEDTAAKLNRYLDSELEARSLQQKREEDELSYEAYKICLEVLSSLEERHREIAYQNTCYQDELARLRRVHKEQDDSHTYRSRQVIDMSEYVRSLKDDAIRTKLPVIRRRLAAAFQNSRWGNIMTEFAAQHPHVEQVQRANVLNNLLATRTIQRHLMSLRGATAMSEPRALEGHMDDNDIAQGETMHMLLLGETLTGVGDVVDDEIGSNALPKPPALTKKRAAMSKNQCVTHTTTVAPAKTIPLAATRSAIKPCNPSSAADETATPTENALNKVSSTKSIAHLPTLTKSVVARFSLRSRDPNNEQAKRRRKRDLSGTFNGVKSVDR